MFGRKIDTGLRIRVNPLSREEIIAYEDKDWSGGLWTPGPGRQAAFSLLQASLNLFSGVYQLHYRARDKGSKPLLVPTWHQPSEFIGANLVLPKTAMESHDMCYSSSTNESNIALAELTIDGEVHKCRLFRNSKRCFGDNLTLCKGSLMRMPLYYTTQLYDMSVEGSKEDGFRLSPWD
jgi:hypothetical protein